jgi:hypothetical protein
MNLPPDFLTGLVGFLLTAMVLSYLIGDSALFRFATYIFVGVSAGYIAVVAFYEVIQPKLIAPLLGANAALSERALALIPLFLCVLILMKISPRLSWLGGPAAGFLAGVAAAVAITGAVLGTIIPQVAAASRPFDVVGSGAQEFDAGQSILSVALGAIMLVGAISTLAYFQFGARRQPDGSVKRNAIVNILAWIGQLFVAITFGALFAGVYAAALAALVERIDFLLNFIFSFLY